MSSDERRLKRGLKDVSNLFVDDSAHEGKFFDANESFLKCVGVYRPMSPSPALISTKMASLLTRCGISSAILSIGRKLEPGVKSIFEGPCLEIPWNDFEQLKRKALSMKIESCVRRQVLFLDFDEHSAEHLRSVVPLLDRWVFTVPPTVDGIIEAYRMIKGTRRLVQSSMQYYLVFEGDIRGREADEVLFEKFSAVLSEKLGINLVWLGHIAAGSGRGNFDDAFDLSHFFLRDAGAYELPDKLALFDHVKAETSKMMSFFDENV